MFSYESKIQKTLEAESCNCWGPILTVFELSELTRSSIYLNSRAGVLRLVQAVLASGLFH